MPALSSSTLNPRTLLAAGLLLFMAALPARAELTAGAIFPQLNATQLEGPLPATAGRVLLVDFWASWCAPCKASFPVLAQLHASYSPRGVTVLGVSEDEKSDAYITFVQRHTPPFATVRDLAHQLASTVKLPAMPTTVVIGRDGRVRAVFAGYHGADTEKAIRAALDLALAEPVSP